MFWRDRFQGSEIVNPGVVHQYIDFAKRLFRLLDERSDLFRLGYVCAHRDCLTACLGDALHDRIPAAL